MVRIREAILVEGRYDKNTLSQIVDATIFETSGFGIFKNKEQLQLLRKVAQKQGLIVFTDADGAGFVIRNHIKSAIPAEFLKHAYTPDIFGKERRKTTASKEGKLGVEGMTKEVVLEALRRAGATFEENTQKETGGITKLDMFFLGLSGNPNSQEKRKALQKMLDLPEHLSANALLDILNLLYSKDEIYRLADLL